MTGLRLVFLDIFYAKRRFSLTAPEESLPSQSAGVLFCGTVVDGSGVALEDVGEGLGTDGHRAAHELRNVVALQELTVVVGVGTGQLEGLGALAVLVDVGEERARVLTVVATAAEDDPLAVAGR